MFILVLNQKNLIQDGLNNKLVYKFPNSVTLSNKYIAVSSISMFYSWNNISVANMNNTLSYSFGTQSYTIVIPDGLYEIAQLNEFIQFECIQNQTYWYVASASSTFYYPFQITVNQTRYAIQLNTYQVPYVGNPTYTSGGATLPALSNTGNFAQVSFPPKFNEIVGYTVNPLGFKSYGDAIQVPSFPNSNNNYASVICAGNGLGGVMSYLSNTAPQVQPNSNLLFTMSNINNPYSQPSSVIYSLAPSVGIGVQIIEKPPQFMWIKLIDGIYNELRLSMVGTDLNAVQINDPNMTILLCIRDRDEAIMAHK